MVNLWMIEVGKLHQCSKFYCLVYPTIETAYAVKDDFGRREQEPARSITGWYNPVSIKIDPKVADIEQEKIAAKAALFRSSAKHACKVFYTNPKHVYLVVATKTIWEEKFVGIIFENQLGWIILKDWLQNAFEIVNQKSNLTLNKNLSPDFLTIG